MLVLVLLAAAAFFGVAVNAHYPLRHWLFFVYLRIWGCVAIFLVASLAAGWGLLRKLCPELPVSCERGVLALALGVLTFALGVFVAGILGLLHSAFFFAWPALLLLASGRSTFRFWRRAVRRLRPFGFRLVAPSTAIEAGAALFLVLSCLMVYLQVMNPQNLGADTHWYHLPIAERYAVMGRIRAFPEGWYLGAYPQLASLLYTWAFLAPGKLFDHAQLASHIEFALLLATLVGVSTLTVKVLREGRYPYACAALFLFPSIFLYDSNLLTGADHVLAFWAVPVALALFRLRDHFKSREAALVGLMVAGAVLTKYQGSYFLVTAALSLVVWGVAKRDAGPVLVAAAACLLASSCHWLKNLIFYGDPLYPLLNRYLPLHPFHEGALPLFQREYFNPYFTPSGTLGARLLGALQVLFTFSFVPHDFPGFHGPRPTFGSLFTLTLPLLLLVRPSRRLWWVVVWAHLGVAVWFLTSHEDRFLQALIPWMATSTAALVTLAWRRLKAGRLVVAVLIAFQVVDGSDLFFMRHGMMGSWPLGALSEHISGGNYGHREDRFRIWGGLQDIARILPPGSGVLMHHYIEELGAGVPVIADGAGWQGAIDYLALDSPLHTVDMWRGLGATFLVWHAGRAPMSPEMWAREAVFVRAMLTFGSGIQSIGGYETSALVKQPGRPDATMATVIAWLGCKNAPAAGLYGARGLADGRPASVLQQSVLASDPAVALASAHVVVVQKDCPGREAVFRELDAHFAKTIDAGDTLLYARR